jgi:hypothetical protein
VALYDFEFPTNHWRLSDAVDFVFPGNLLLPGDSRLLVVGFEPTNAAKLAVFRAKWGFATNIPVLGPWSGKLNNTGDDVRLERPDAPNTDGFVPYLLTDRVRYRHAAPWPLGADGTGAALWRSPADSYGDEPANWRVAHPIGSTPVDSDADLMPDWWEIFRGLNPALPDSTLDPDGDGMTNLQEWMARLNPHEPLSVLHLNVTLSPQGSPLISFDAQPDIGYTLERASSLATASWSSWQHVDPADSGRTVIFADAVSQGGVFYRLVTPRK